MTMNLDARSILSEYLSYRRLTEDSLSDLPRVLASNIQIVALAKSGRLFCISFSVSDLHTVGVTDSITPDTDARKAAIQALRNLRNKDPPTQFFVLTKDELLAKSIQQSYAWLASDPATAAVFLGSRKLRNSYGLPSPFRAFLSTKQSKRFTNASSSNHVGKS